jgi:DNA-binding response OmpR family regulator
MLLSAHAHEEDVRRGFDAGADDYLRKPFRPHELLALVEAMVGRKDSASRENGAAPGKDRAA